MATIVSIAPYKFLPAQIGGQKGIALFNKYFSRHHKLICLTVEGNHNDLAEGYESKNILSKNRYRYINPLVFFKVRNILSKSKATHLLIEHPYFGWLGYLLAKAAGVRLIVHSHNIESLRFKTFEKWWWKILWYYEKFIHRFADYNFFIQKDDLNYAVEHFKVDQSKCIVVTYGIEIEKSPTQEEKLKAKEFLRIAHSIPDDEKILLFAGSFDYKPNIDALKTIDEVICDLLDKKSFRYKVLVCGPWLKNFSPKNRNIILTGFVESIDPYFLGADVFLNPTRDGGGIKTKLVEALGFNTNSVSTQEGATGIDLNFCNGKLSVVEDQNWEKFGEEIIRLSVLENNMSPEFYQHFYWGYTTERAAKFVEYL